MRVMGFDPAGNLWVGGRFILFGQAGLGMLSADQLQFAALPGGGFETGAWRVWSNVHHPIPSPYFNDLKFSADGTVWLASDAGLTRFRREAAPAEQWFTFTPVNSPLVQNEVRSLAVDSQGNVWVTNANVNGNGPQIVFKLDPASNQWTQFNIGQMPWMVTVGNNDHVFVSMSNETGVMEWDGNTWTLHNGAGVQLDSLLQDAQGNVWAGSHTSSLWRWNGSTWQNWSLDSVTGLGTDRNGVVHVSTFNGSIFRIINDAPQLFFNAEVLPSGIFGRPNGDLWVKNYGSGGMLGTVRHYNSNGSLLRRINTYNSGLPDFFVDRIIRDSVGNMWFASPEGGLSRMLGSNGAMDAATHWRNWGNHNDASEPNPWAGNDPMYSLLEDGNGIFWMGGNGIGRWDSHTGQFTNFWNWQNSAIDTAGVTAIAKRDGTIWAGMGGSGLYWFDGANWIHVSLSPGTFDFNSNNVKSIAVDIDGNLWVGSQFGLRKFAPGNNTTFTQYDSTNSPLPSVYILNVEPDPAGGIWLGTDNGLVHYDGGTTWRTYNPANTGMPGKVVFDIARRPSDGLIAISNFQVNTTPYTGGVSTFDGTTWTHYTPQNSPLTHFQNVAVEFDSHGHLWASPTSEGVVQILLGPDAVPQLQSAVSRKTHGSIGTFDIDLPLSGEPGVECRSSGGAHTLVFTFDANVVAGTAQIETGRAALSNAAFFAGNTMTVELTGVMDRQTITVTLSNVTSEAGGVLAQAAVSLHLFAGDTTGNKTVNATDVSQTKAQVGQPVTAANFRSDVLANGSISATDVAVVKSKVGQALERGK